MYRLAHASVMSSQGVRLSTLADLSGDGGALLVTVGSSSATNINATVSIIDSMLLNNIAGTYISCAYCELGAVAQAFIVLCAYAAAGGAAFVNIQGAFSNSTSFIMSNSVYASNVALSAFAWFVAGLCRNSFASLLATAVQVGQPLCSP